MDLTAVIEMHREALKRIVDGLVAMVWGPLFSREGASRLAQADSGPSPSPSPAPTLPRRVHRAVLTLLRPAESAARRLVIVLARAIVVSLSPQHPRKARRTSLFARNGVGTGIVRRPGAPVPPVLPASRPLSFPLLDPLPLFRRARPRAAGVPRICIPGLTAHLAVPARKPPLPDDPLDAGHLFRRLAALARALDDLPGQARRFARWQARRDRALAAGRIHRVAPLRGGGPPGGRLSRYEPDARRRRNIREIDEILAHAHALAHFALRPDTS